MTNPKMSNITQKWIEILEPFTSELSGRFSATELSKKVELSQQTISRYLNEMADLNLMKYERRGRNKYFFLDLEKRTTKIIIEMVEHQKALKFQLDSGKVVPLVNKLLKHCSSLIVFGSYASGKYDSDSDLDIVVLKSQKKPIKKIKRAAPLIIDDEQVTYRDFMETLKSEKPLAVEIYKNHVIFGDISRIVDIFLRCENG